MPELSSITALDALLDDMRVGEARRRQLGMVRGELQRALARLGVSRTTLYKYVPELAAGRNSLVPGNAPAALPSPR